MKSINGINIPDTAIKIKPWFSNINKKFVAWTAKKPFLIFISTFIISSLIVGIPNFGIPSYKDIFWSNDLFIDFASIFILSLVLVFIHEIGHFVSTKAVGGQAVMRVGYRYLYVVAETQSYHLAMATKKQRYLVYLSGILVDLFIIALSYWIMVISNWYHINLGILYPFLKMIIITEIIGIIWEFDAFLETDMYNFLTEFLGIENLRSDALKYITLHTRRLNKILLFPIKVLLKLFNKEYEHMSDDLRTFSKSERIKLYIYIIFLIAGLVFTTFQYFYYSIPRDITFLLESFQNTNQAFQTVNVVLLFKSLIIILYTLYEYILLIILKMKGDRRNLKH